jgi:2-oxoglutarate ferredoxin oxidoreductase subunit alpha
MKREEVRYEAFLVEDADIVLVAFGTAGRIAKTAIREARQRGLRVGLVRPMTLFPFPTAFLATLAEWIDAFLVVEMNAGQMVEDVRLAVAGRAPVYFYGHTGGVIPFPDEILTQLEALGGVVTRQEMGQTRFWDSNSLPLPI